MEQHIQIFRDDYQENVRKIWLVYQAGKYEETISLSRQVEYPSEVDSFLTWMVQNEDFFQQVLLTLPATVDFIFGKLTLLDLDSPQIFNTISRLYEVLKDRSTFNDLMDEQFIPRL